MLHLEVEGEARVGGGRTACDDDDGDGDDAGSHILTTMTMMGAAVATPASKMLQRSTEATDNKATST